MRQTAFQSATLKLTAYYMMIMLVICIMFSAAIYHFADNELRQGLHSQSQRIVQQYPGFDFAPALRSTPDYQQAAHRILLNLIYFNLFVLILASFAGYELAKRTLRPIELSHEQQNRFTADVSHELRTPLTALKMSTEVALLDHKARPAELRAALTSNLEEAGKLELLINNLLRLTRLEASELQESFSRVDLSQLISGVVADESERAAAKHISLHQTAQPQLTVLGDQASLAQVLHIVLDNALKYSPEGSPIEINAERNQDSAVITIVDHGIGIDASELPFVFDRFYRADAARTRSESSGFGLGLSIAKHIADIHGGSVQLTSAAGSGTTASVILPAAT